MVMLPNEKLKSRIAYEHNQKKKLYNERKAFIIHTHKHTHMQQNIIPSTVICGARYADIPDMSQIGDFHSTIVLDEDTKKMFRSLLKSLITAGEIVDG